MLEFAMGQNLGPLGSVLSPKDLGKTNLQRSLDRTQTKPPKSDGHCFAHDKGGCVGVCRLNSQNDIGTKLRHAMVSQDSCALQLAI